MPKCIQCTKQSFFNFPNEKKGLYCYDHKKGLMINIYSKKCLKCGKRAIFNFENESKGLFCADHKTSEMIDFNKKMFKMWKKTIF